MGITIRVAATTALFALVSSPAFAFIVDPGGGGGGPPATPVPIAGIGIGAALLVGSGYRALKRRIGR